MLIKRRVAQTRFGRRKGKVAKIPLGENMLGIDSAGFAKVPPIAGPMIVPILHTNGMTAYARAATVNSISYSTEGADLTLMLWLLDQLSNHGLNDSNVPIFNRVSYLFGEIINIWSTD